MEKESILVREIDGFIAAYGSYIVGGALVYVTASIVAAIVGIWIIKQIMKP